MNRPEELLVRNPAVASCNRSWSPRVDGNLPFTPISRSIALFTDPQSVTINSVAQSLPRTEQEGQSASYTKEDGTLVLKVSHQATKNGRLRHAVKLDQNKIAADPFVAGNSRLAGSAITLVIDEPDAGQFTNNDLLLLAKGLIGWATDANLTKVIAGES